MSTSDSMGDGPPSKKARFGDDSGKTSFFFINFSLNILKQEFMSSNISGRFSIESRLGYMF